jgi:hypothetical protein
VIQRAHSVGPGWRGISSWTGPSSREKLLLGCAATVSTGGRKNGEVQGGVTPRAHSVGPGWRAISTSTGPSSREQQLLGVTLRAAVVGEACVCCSTPHPSWAVCVEHTMYRKATFCACTPAVANSAASVRFQHPVIAFRWCRWVAHCAVFCSLG